jgi:xanthine/CO dehydrogenase XdhC/CoxF family maturation factor
MLVYPDGTFIGTVGGGDLEHRVLDEAWMAISDGQPRHLHYNMADPSRGDPGVCGGQVEVFVEPILPPPLLVVIGAGHVGKAVVHLAKWLGFRTAVSDDRAEFCTPEATPGADAYYPAPDGGAAGSTQGDAPPICGDQPRVQCGRGRPAEPAQVRRGVHRRHRVEAQMDDHSQSVEGDRAYPMI